MDKILTIVIPTYNMEKYLRKCLDSLIIDDKELFGKLEVLVVNDGSKDSSSAIAHEYQDNYPNVFRVIDKENGNYGSCVNRGLKEANGKYIKILDADDWLDRKMFSYYLMVMNTLNSDVILNNCLLINEKGKTIGKCEFSDDIQELQFPISDLKAKPSMHCVAYRTSMLRDANYYQTEGISYTDQEWVTFPFVNANTVYYLPVFLYQYILGREGQTMDINIRRRKVGDLEIVMNSLIEFYKEYEGDQIHRKYLHNKVVEVLSSFYKDALIKRVYTEELIEKWDNYLKNEANEIYMSLIDIKAYKYLNIPYIRWWREGSSLFLLRMLYKLRKVL